MPLEKYWLELIFGLISTGALAFCKYLWNEVQTYREIIAQRENEIVVKTIEDKLKPIQDEIARLELYIDQVSSKESKDISKIVSSWGFRIKQLCEMYFEQGYMTQHQYVQLLEMYNLYRELGGNGKIQELFEMTTKSLEVR